MLSTKSELSNKHVVFTHPDMRSDVADVLKLVARSECAVGRADGTVNPAADAANTKGSAREEGRKYMSAGLTASVPTPSQAKNFSLRLRLNLGLILGQIIRQTDKKLV
jgi:hypothetical protein